MPTTTTAAPAPTTTTTTSPPLKGLALLGPIPPQKPAAYGEFLSTAAQVDEYDPNFSYPTPDWPAVRLASDEPVQQVVPAGWVPLAVIPAADTHIGMLLTDTAVVGWRGIEDLTSDLDLERDYSRRTSAQLNVHIGARLLLPYSTAYDPATLLPMTVHHIEMRAGQYNEIAFVYFCMPATAKLYANAEIAWDGLILPVRLNPGVEPPELRGSAELPHWSIVWFGSGVEPERLSDIEWVSSNRWARTGRTCQ